MKTADRPLSLVPATSVRTNPRPGVRRDPTGQTINSPHRFVTTGLARLWRNGKPGSWFKVPCEDPS